MAYSYLNNQITSFLVDLEQNISVTCHWDARKARSLSEALYIRNKNLIQEILAAGEGKPFLEFFHKRLGGDFLSQQWGFVELKQTLSIDTLNNSKIQYQIHQASKLSEWDSELPTDTKEILGFLSVAVGLRGTDTTPGFEYYKYIMAWFPQCQFEVERDPKTGYYILFTSRWAWKKPIAIVKSLDDGNILYQYANIYTQWFRGFREFVSYNKDIPLIDEKGKSILV